MRAYPRQLHKTVWRKNPISGHEWPEHTPIAKWEVGGAGGQPLQFRSEKQCQEHCDYLNKVWAEAGLLTGEEQCT